MAGFEVIIYGRFWVIAEVMSFTRSLMEAMLSPRIAEQLVCSATF